MINPIVCVSEVYLKFCTQDVSANCQLGLLICPVFIQMVTLDQNIYFCSEDFKILADSVQYLRDA